MTGLDWAAHNSGYLLSLTWRHAWLSVTPVVLGFAIALPVGWAAHRSPRWGGALLAGWGIVYTIPSLAMFTIVPSVLGLGFLSPVNVVVALTAYAVAIMVRTVADALASVPAEVLSAATATGHSPAQRFWRVQLPLAGPVMLAGLRVVSVSTVSLVTVGSLIGVDNLGSLFTDGFARDFVAEIVVGIALVLLLAVALDLLWLAAGRLLMPWTVLR